MLCDDRNLQLYSNKYDLPQKVVINIYSPYGWMDRFLKRADAMKIPDYPPSQLENSSTSNNEFDELSMSIWSLFCSKAQTEDSYKERVNLWNNLWNFILKCFMSNNFHSFNLLPVGSTMTGFSLDNSDLDICLFIEPSALEPLYYLRSLKNYLSTCGVISDLIEFAKVPIIKLQAHLQPSTSLNIDLSCNNVISVKNTRLLYSYSKLDWRVRPLVVVVKLWAKINDIGDAKNNTLSSYSWTLLVIHYLQCGAMPCVLPCLHEISPEEFSQDNDKTLVELMEMNKNHDFQSTNIQSLGELLVGFFKYFSTFDFENHVISVRAGRALSVKDLCIKSPKLRNGHVLFIEEPFDVLSNTCKTVTEHSLKNIVDIITESGNVLENDENLSSILPVSESKE